MFNPNSITNSKPDSSQQPSGPLLSSDICLIPNLDEKKNTTTTTQTESKTSNDLNNYISDCEKREYGWSEFDQLVEGINSEDQFKQYFGLIGIRKLRCNIISSHFNICSLAFTPESYSQIQKVLDAGILPKIVELMNKDDELQLQVRNDTKIHL